MENKSKCCGWIAIELIGGIYHCGNCSKECEIVTVSDEGKEPDYEIGYCSKCIQSTNHLAGVCQKCKVTPPESWEEEFDDMLSNNMNNLGIADLLHNSDGGEIIKKFISQTLSTEKAKWMKEWRDKIGNGRIKELELLERHINAQIYQSTITTDSLLRYIETRINLLTTPSEQEEEK